MSENIRALIVILFIATAFFATANSTAISITNSVNFTRRKNLWLAMTTTAFVSYNFWLYTLVAFLLLNYTNKRESNPPALYFSLLFVIPVASIQIPGFGLINFLFELSHPRILSLFILLPAFFKLKRDKNSLPLGKSSSDKALFAYLLLCATLYLRDSSFTNNLRQIFYLFIDVFLPYYIISRELRDMQAFRDALLSLVFAIMILALLAIFEFVKHWVLYETLTDVLKLEAQSGYLARDGMLRAVATAGQAIALGYLMVVGIGIFLFIQNSVTRTFMRWSGMSLLILGLITPLSRGPWIGSIFLIGVFFATGRYAIRRLLSLALIGIITLSLISVLPGGQRIINLLPFIGSTEKENVDYREQLITNSLIVIKRNPWFGSINYLNTPEMEAMRQGQGIIDIVNSYIQVALATGLVGLGLYVSFFLLTLWGLFRAITSSTDKESDEQLLGRALFSTLSAILFIIFTVSSITIIPIVYWSVAGLSVAYITMIKESKKSKFQSITTK